MQNTYSSVRTEVYDPSLRRVVFTELIVGLRSDAVVQ